MAVQPLLSSSCCFCLCVCVGVSSLLYKDPCYWIYGSPVYKGPSSQDYGFSSSHIWMWELDFKERWAPKNWCFWTVVLEKTLESPLDCKGIQPVHAEWNQSWIFIRKTDVKAETPILWLPDVKSWLIWKDPDAGKDLRWEGKGDDRRWDDWMASPTQWTWVWVDSGS